MLDYVTETADGDEIRCDLDSVRGRIIIAVGWRGIQEYCKHTAPLTREEALRLADVLVATANHLERQSHDRPM